MSFESKIFAPDYPFSPKRVPFFYGRIMFFVVICARMVSVPGHGVGLAPFTEAVLENLEISRFHFSNIFSLRPYSTHYVYHFLAHFLIA
jgi:hypothetical protein